MANFAAGVICLHMFSIVMLKKHKILLEGTLAFFSLHKADSTDSQLPEETAILSDSNDAKKELKD